MSDETVPRFVDRPKTTVESKTRARLVRDTLANGQALSIPINGDTYAVARNRVVGGVWPSAKKLNAMIRTAKSADGLSVLVWLEAK